jgi:hypothetical protein
VADLRALDPVELDGDEPCDRRIPFYKHHECEIGRGRMRFLVVALFFVLAGGAFAWEETLSRLGIERRQIESNLESALEQGGVLATPRIPRNAVAMYQGMNETERVKVVKDGIALAKTILSSDPFRQANDERIRKQYGGIDHGLKVVGAEELNRQLSARKITRAAYEQAMIRMRSGSAAERAFRAPADSLKGSLESDLRSAEYIAKEMPNEKPDPKKRIEMLQAALALYGQEAAFRRAAAAALSFGAGGTADPAEAEQCAKEEQQRIYDEYSIQTKLRSALNQFVQIAGQVNFAATTVPKGNKQVFADPAMERASSVHKFLYRLGKGPTMAAVGEAKAWMAELH